MIIHKQLSKEQEEAWLSSVRLLVQALYTLCVGVLSLLFGLVKIVAAVVTLALGLLSFVLYGVTVMCLDMQVAMAWLTQRMATL